MIQDANRIFDYYSVSPNIRQTFLHWCYELIESDLL